MADSMVFPNDWAKFLEDYSFRDHKEFYTNGARLIPTFRVEQMTHHYLRKAVADFATENNFGHRWIPVTERLPEKDGIYLTFNKKKEYEFHFFQTGKRMWPAVWDEDGVTHWMPLPEPPKEGDTA